jgi:predicted phage tail protein
MIELRNPILVKTELGDGMVIYVVNSGTYANDVWTVALNDGRVRHFRTDQITMEDNATWNINIDKDKIK